MEKEKIVTIYRGAITRKVTLAQFEAEYKKIGFKLSESEVKDDGTSSTKSKN